MISALDDLDDDHLAAAAWTRGSDISRFDQPSVGGRIARGDREQLAGALEIILACAAGEQAVVADAVKALGQGVQQEAADELIGGECHDLLPVGAAPAIVFIAEGDARLVEPEEAAVRDGDAVGVAR